MPPKFKLSCSINWLSWVVSVAYLMGTLVFRDEFYVPQNEGLNTVNMLISVISIGSAVLAFCGCCLIFCDASSFACILCYIIPIIFVIPGLCVFALMEAGKADVGASIEEYVINAWKENESTRYLKETEINLVFDTNESIHELSHYISIDIICNSWMLSFVSRTLGYSTSKWVVMMVTEGLALELWPKGIRVNIRPGFIENQQWHDNAGYGPEVGIAFKKGNPLGRNGRVDDIVNVVIFLASDAASYVNGVAIPVDGGITKTIQGTSFD